jgi:hypothetical protein
LLLAVLVASLACGSDGSGPEQPIDGEWEILGVYSDLDPVVRCRLEGEVSITAVGGGANTLTGAGTYTLDCDVDGDAQTAEGGAAVERSSLTGDYLTLNFGDCGFIGTYRSTSPRIMKGHAVCNISFPQRGTVGLIGSWQADRIS